MRILIVSEDIPYPNMGGLAKHALNLARALIRSGHQVDILGGDQHPIEVAGEEGQFGGRFFGELSGHKIGWKETKLGMFIPARRTWVAKRFAQTIMRHARNYDVIHYHGHTPNVAAFIPEHVNFVQTRHDQGGDCIAHTRFRFGEVCTTPDPAVCATCMRPQPNLLQRSFSSAAVNRLRKETAYGYRRHKTIFVSDLLQRNFARTMGPGPWGKTIHNFVDISALKRARNSVATSSRKPHIQVFIAGRLSPAKGIVPFLRELMPRLPEHMYVNIAGDGNGDSKIKAEFTHERIKFLGWCSPETTLQHTINADVIVVPSVWEDPCPTTILEGLLLGKPTFALNRGGTPELSKYASAPEQLRLFEDMKSLVDGLISRQSYTQYRPADHGPGGVDYAMTQILEVYRMPPGQIFERL